MRYYPLVNLIRCLRWRPGNTLLAAFIFFWMLVGAQNIIDYQRKPVKDNHTELTQEQIEFGNWLQEEWNKPVPTDRDYTDVPVYNWDYETQW